MGCRLEAYRRHSRWAMAGWLSWARVRCSAANRSRRAGERAASRRTLMATRLWRSAPFREIDEPHPAFSYDAGRPVGTKLEADRRGTGIVNQVLGRSRHATIEQGAGPSVLLEQRHDLAEEVGVPATLGLEERPAARRSVTPPRHEIALALAPNEPDPWPIPLRVWGLLLDGAVQQATPGRLANRASRWPRIGPGVPPSP